MISTRVKVPNRLIIKLSRHNMDIAASQLVGKIADEALLNVMRYGVGTAGGNDAMGGAPYWQGKITVEGHRRGYLSDSHFIHFDNPYHAKISSSASFVDGVLQGYSTNWHGVRFGANNYPKRAVDTLISDGRIHTIWRNVIKSNLS